MTNREVTAELAAWTADLSENDVPDEVRAECVRTFVNWYGCALGGADHPAVQTALRALSPLSGPRVATVLGRTDRLDQLHAALLNGISSHVLDYDDTHLKTIIHPAGPVASSLLALAEARPMSGERFLTALAAGVEATCRIGNCVYPDHYDRGWHITGTAGVFGAAAACGLAVGLDRERMTWALSLAGTQSSGLRGMFGTMTKAFHPGSAAMNGLRAALMAEAGFTSADDGIEGRRGWAIVLSDKQAYGEILDGLGTRWEAALNSYKPFACGIVIHPTIDGCRQIGDEIGERVHEIAAVQLRTHPLVLELTGNRTPATGLQSKFSVYHAAACALLRGDGSPSAFTDEVVALPEIIALRDLVTATADPQVHEASVSITVTFTDGSVLEKHVERAIGSRERPLSDAQLDEKFLAQATWVVGEDVAKSALAAARRIGSTDPAAVARASVPRVGVAAE